MSQPTRYLLFLITLLLPTWIHAQVGEKIFFKDHFLQLIPYGLQIGPNNNVYSLDIIGNNYEWNWETGELIGSHSSPGEARNAWEREGLDYIFGDNAPTFPWRKVEGKWKPYHYFKLTYFDEIFEALDIGYDLDTVKVAADELDKSNRFLWRKNEDTLTVWSFPEEEVVYNLQLSGWKEGPNDWRSRNKRFSGLFDDAKYFAEFGYDGVNIWNIVTGKLHDRIDFSSYAPGVQGNPYYVHDAHPWKDHLLITYTPAPGKDPVLARLNLNAGKVDVIYDSTINVRLEDCPQGALRIGYDKTGERVFCGNFIDRIGVYAAESGENVMNLRQPIVPLELRARLGHVQDVYKTEIVDANTVRTSDKDKKIDWDLRTGQQINVAQNDKYKGDIPSIADIDNLEYPTDLCTTADPLAYLGAKQITADQRYHYEADTNFLLPLCPNRDDTLFLDFKVAGISRSGKQLYQLADGQLTTWSYPELQRERSVPLEGYNSSVSDSLVLVRYKSANFQQHALTATGRYFLAYLRREIMIWDAATGRLAGSGDFSAYRPVQEGVVMGDPLAHYLVQELHPTEDQLLISHHPLGEGYGHVVSGFDLATSRINVSYDTLFKSNALHQFRLNRYTSDGKTVITSGLLDSISVTDAKTGQRLRVLRSPADGYSSELQVDTTSGELLLGNVADKEWRKRIHLGERIISGPTTGEITERPSNVHAYYTGPNLDSGSPFYYGEEVLIGPVTFEDVRNLYHLHRDSLDKQDKVPTVPSGATLRVFSWKKSRKLGYYYIYQLRDTQTVAKYRFTEKSGVGEVITYRDEKIAYLSRNKVKVRDKTGKLLGEDAYENVLKYVFNQSLVFSKDGRFLFVAVGNGKIQIYDGNNATHLATFIPLYENDWVVIGPNNVFDASPGAMDGIYFVATDENRNADTLGLDQMKERYYDPGLLQKIMGYHEAPIRSGKSLREVKFFPKAQLKLTGDSLHVQLMPRSGGVGRVALFANGKELDADARPDQESLSFIVDLSQYQQFFLRDNQISIRTYNEEENLRSDDISVDYTYAAGPQVKPRGSGTTGKQASFTREEAQQASLHVICVGTSDYAGEAIDLTFPNQDAQAMSKAVQATGNELFGTNGTVSVHCLTTDSAAVQPLLAADSISWQYASKTNIEGVFQTVQQSAKAQDVVVVYLSGHGKTVNVNNKEQFHYLTHQSSSANVIDRSTLADIAISSAELTNWLKKIPAYKQVVIIDACNSGQMITDLGKTRNLNGSQVRALDRMSGRAGMYLIAGSAGDMVSYESSEFGQGVLTYALLKGMREGGGLVKDEKDENNNFVGVTELFEYAQQEVPKLTKNMGIQQPQVTYPARAGSFPMGIYNKDVKIPLADAKPLIVRAQFQEETTFLDELKLEEKVAAKFRQHSKSKKGSYVYANVNRLPNAYQVRGRYVLNEAGEVIVRAVISREGEAPIPLKIAPKKPKKIAAAISFAVEVALRELKAKKDED